MTPRRHDRPSSLPFPPAATWWQSGWRVLLALPRHLARLLIRIYRYTLSPLIGLECRHLPTCSAYADESFERFGFWAGGWMTLARLCRCHPFGTSGLDFVCEEIPPRARWYLPWRYGRWRGTDPGPAFVPPADAGQDKPLEPHRLP